MTQEGIKEESIEQDGFGEFRDVEPDIWKPESEGDQIVGLLVNKEPRQGDLSARYFLDVEGKVKLVWGCKVLDSRMELVKVGDLVRITYKGTQETKKGRRVHIYKVEAAERRE